MSSSASESVSERFSPGLRRAVGVVMIGASLSFLDTTIVNVALHTLSTDLHTGLDTVQWVVTAYLLALAAVIPVTGWAARRFGAERLYVAALVVFTVGSVLCACSSSIGMLIAARALQGLGGGALMPVGTIIWTAYAQRSQMGKVIAFLAMPIILAPALGPALGGLLIQGIDWQAIFWLNVPVGIAGVVLAVLLLPCQARGEAGRLDVFGLVLAALGVVGIIFGLTRLGATGGIEPADVIALVVGVGALAAFIAYALRARHPLLDVRLYRSRAFAAASIATFALGAANYGGMVLMPIYLQTVRGEGVVIAGLLVAPTAIGALLSAPFTDRWGAGITSFVGAVVLSISTVPFLFLTATTSYWLLCTVMVVRGAGFGLSILPTMTAAYQALPAAKIAEATPQLNVLQRVGGAIGTAVLTVVLTGQLHNVTTPAAQAEGFAITFAWVLGAAVIATIPTILLIYVERQSRPRWDEVIAGTVTDAGR